MPAAVAYGERLPQRRCRRQRHVLPMIRDNATREEVAWAQKRQAVAQVALPCKAPPSIVSQAMFPKAGSARGAR